ncbi:type II toxin-antitoxin system tRNA(fMet)-specific endonuclease VapC [Thiothrix fructosivorans]|uniref:Ribonuclease VapC n=1 Tax=Thiothrix fructosivorans TaxID=111770 RepID=A0A8B0SP34_9GAMM|nr:type II toxin-antitoxin system VapC family toxin [Thiothrix fructosivorans]MBO0614198.1 type II toxin-antitoxin system VapC family toxin [Thiothrix fructosivorans]QTX12679.1 type II toxin-antitoxin system VapC family toxin [Thiothrix fructosivorans]
MVLKYLLDTNICIYIAKHKPPEVLARFNELEAGEVAMSVVTYGELYNGAMKSQHQAVALQKLAQLLTFIPALPLADTVGQHYGEIRSHLEQAGTTIGNNDLWIAAHARELGITLVTNNLREFERVPELVAENWVG